MKMDDQKIGERLLRFRQEKKLSQAEFAGRLGVSPGAYKNYERGDREIPASVLLALHQEFEVDPLWLITAEDDDSLRPRMRPKHDLKLLEGVGMDVEGDSRARKIFFKCKETENYKFCVCELYS
jgi:transcriptional regulator with XRE-family HTH domain